MTTGTKRRRIGKLGWFLIILGASLALLYGGLRYVIANHPAATLDAIDRYWGGTAGARLAAGDVAYGPLPAQRLVVYTPEGPPQKHPVLVFIHGGSWRSGSPGDYHFIGRNFAREGYVVVVPGYRLTPEGKFPHMLEDGAAAAAWTRAHVADYGGDPDRVFLMGHSAGAHNVLMLTLDRQWLGREGLPEGFVKGTIGLAGPYDFYPFTDNAARLAFGHEPDPAKTQPITYARGDAPPLLLATGDEDTTVKPRNTLALAKAMSGAGAPTQGVIFKGMSHSDIIMKLARPFNRDARVRDAVLAFLAQHGGAASAPVQTASR